MSAAIITFTDKVPYQANVLPLINQVTADDLNALKNAINNHAALIDQLRKPLGVSVTAADFSGENYDNTNLVGLTAGVDFQVYSNEGSGVLLKPTDGYTFNPALGRITTSAGNYFLTIFIPL